VKQSDKNWIQKCESLKCCVIIPTYNNAGTIKPVVESVLKYCSTIFVINDGSSDSTLQLLADFKSSIKLISYNDNKGKGHAILLGFRAAFEQGFEYAITIDSDGQHFAYDIPIFIEALENERQAVIIGARQLKQKNMSSGSSFANKFSNFWFKVETGITLPDTQSGFRLYPLKPISEMKFFTKKYEFEIESIVRLAWRGYKVISVPVDVFYPTKEERVSHFRPFKDFFRISVLNTVLVILALLFFLPRNIVRKYKGKKLKNIIKDELFTSQTPLHKKSLSIAFGVFMGIVPIWGYQLLVGFTLAHFLKLNKKIFFVFANISLPPMIPLILYLSYIFGGYIFGEVNWAVNLHNVSFETIKRDLKVYLVGSVALAAVAAALFGAVSYIILSIVEPKTKTN
jgi:glycosyltransferase involved in cell wall biosynthesis